MSRHRNLRKVSIGDDGNWTNLTIFTFIIRTIYNQTFLDYDDDIAQSYDDKYSFAVSPGTSKKCPFTLSF